MKTILKLFIVGLVVTTYIGFFSPSTLAQACTLDYNATNAIYYDQQPAPQIGHRAYLWPANDAEATVRAICGSVVGCPAGTMCLVGGQLTLLPPPNWPYGYGTYDGTCSNPTLGTSGICSSLTDEMCIANQVICESSSDTCYDPGNGSTSICQFCANAPGATEGCTEDSECCDALAGEDLVCNVGTGDCVEEPPTPAAASCDASKIANGEVCDYVWWNGDDGNCSNCVSGATTTSADGIVCAALPLDASCASGADCACSSGVCNENADGNLVCSISGSCVDSMGGNCSLLDCCDSISGTPAVCGPTDRCIADPAVCAGVSEGSACGNDNSRCCPAQTGLTCYNSHCTDSTIVGLECNHPGRCMDGACDYGEICANGICEVNATCSAALTVNPYTGPIVDFNTLLERIYVFLYPVGIVLGLFFIIQGGYKIMTSEGDPSKIAEGKEQLTAAIIGTLFIILSLVILRVIISALLGVTL